MNARELLLDWLTPRAEGRTAPLFLEHNLVVEMFRGGSLQKLRRHPDFDSLMIATVEGGLAEAAFQGIVYIMQWRRGGIVPLYVGKAERTGVSQVLSANLAQIRANHQRFGRWGYGIAYHVGDLSHAVLGGQAYKQPSPKYRRWADVLFEKMDPPTLRERVYVTLLPWCHGMRGPSGLISSVPAAEKELIALAAAAFPETLLNIDGR